MVAHEHEHRRRRVRVRRRSHRGLRLMVFTLSWALLVTGFALLAGGGLTKNRAFLCIGALYILVGLALLGIRQAAAAYSDMRRARHAGGREAGSGETFRSGSESLADAGGAGLTPRAPASGEEP